jgi:hypothetical protein
MAVRPVMRIDARPDSVADASFPACSARKPAAMRQNVRLQTLFATYRVSGSIWESLDFKYVRNYRYLEFKIWTIRSTLRFFRKSCTKIFIDEFNIYAKMSEGCIISPYSALIDINQCRNTGVMYL